MFAIRFWKPLFGLAVMAMAFAVAILPDRALEAREAAPTTAKSIATVQESDLPQEAKSTLAMIVKGGPFPYAKDGVIFSNRERILPKQPRGYYREYTVKTPGARNRGAKRIVCGGKVTADAASRECYYTDDHYATFLRIKS